MAVFWVVALLSQGDAPMMEAASTSETTVNFYQTTRRYNPEDSHLQIKRVLPLYRHSWYSVIILLTSFYLERWLIACLM
jgi:hypothetical protein